MTPADPAVVTTGAGHRYGTHWALRDCTLSLPAGSVTAVVGPNGAGKTTLLTMLIGLLAASEGDVRVDGVLVAHARSDEDAGGRVGLRATAPGVGWDDYAVGPRPRPVVRRDE